MLKFGAKPSRTSSGSQLEAGAKIPPRDPLRGRLVELGIPKLNHYEDDLNNATRAPKPPKKLAGTRSVTLSSSPGPSIQTAGSSQLPEQGLPQIGGPELLPQRASCVNRWARLVATRGASHASGVVNNDRSNKAKMRKKWASGVSGRSAPRMTAL